jgi:hypothetical protein
VFQNKDIWKDALPYKTAALRRIEWTEKEYCDKCYHVRLKFMKGDKDKDGVVQNIHIISEKIRPQTEVEKEQRLIR